MSDSRRWMWVAVYALAMAWVEAAVVYALRLLVDRIVPWQPHPLPDVGPLGAVELVREGATLVMLAAVGVLAGHSARSRFGYACVAFGIWDMGYYLFLRLMTGWPASLLDWDILFLLPLPWWGPVLAPLLISVLLIVGGTQLTRGAARWPAWGSVVAATAGALLALATFMADALRVAPQGEEALRDLLPTRFGWAAFAVALVLMAVPVIDLARPWRSARALPPSPSPSPGRIEA